MVDDNYGFRDDEERKAFYIALPVLALFGGLLYYFVFASDDAAMPELAGATMAFTDTDADGIADHLDKCANESGSLENHGCLTAQKDDAPVQPAQPQTARTQTAVQESVAAAIDADETAAMKTVELIEPEVPEATNNTIVRQEPEPEPEPEPKPELRPEPEPEPEPESKPEPEVLDSDADGFANDADACPDVAGKEEGCPADTDADGYLDADDACPDTAGTDNGCPPDKDADGVPDDTDACPDTAGTDNGCPSDNDGDGVPDDTDACPETAGTDKGCPADADADGVPDERDACPDTAGTIKGCPVETSAAPELADTDADGIADNADKCPDIAGVAENKGCPASTAIALKPSEPVTESAEQLVQDAGFSIQFNAGNSVLTGRSSEILLEVANVMERYPDIDLEAHGFTDSEGAAEVNKSLSLRRAQACIDVIAEAGIDRERLKALGFGEAQPIASNSTSVGRQKNRRVEFKLIR